MASQVIQSQGPLMMTVTTLWLSWRIHVCWNMLQWCHISHFVNQSWQPGSLTWQPGSFARGNHLGNTAGWITVFPTAVAFVTRSRTCTYLYRQCRAFRWGPQGGQHFWASGAGALRTEGLAQQWTWCVRSEGCCDLYSKLVRRSDCRNETGQC